MHLLEVNINIKPIVVFPIDYKTHSAVDAQVCKWKKHVYCNSSTGSFVTYIYIYIYIYIYCILCISKLNKNSYPTPAITHEKKS